ncbi:MAG: hypothetical protein AAB390_01605 [Patescibacteria group bacterium]|mgnify:CR=1 FL=1
MLLTKMRLKVRWDQIKKRIIKPEIYSEAFFAYFHKIPNNIQVEWFRDGDFIIGNVTAGDKKFITQGLNTDDFVRMVNESLVVVYDIPQNYTDLILKNKPFAPSVEERKKLDDISIMKSSFGSVVKKKEGDLQLA